MTSKISLICQMRKKSIISHTKRSYRGYMRFYKIYVEISDICGLDCPFCTPKKATRGIMPLPLFKDIIRQISDYTNLISLHVLGDPLYIEKLDEYIAAGLHYDVKFDIVSSGAFLQQRHFSTLTQKNIHQVSFSLDALFNHKHLNKSIQKYMDKIIELHKYADSHAPNLYINMRLFGKHDYTYLLQRFPNAIMQTEKRRLRLAKNFFLRFHKPFTWHITPELDLKNSLPLILKTEKVINFRDSKTTNSKISDFKTQDSKTSKTKQSILKPHCFGAIKQLAILANGIVVPCCIDANGSMMLGNLLEKDFASILKSSTMKALQKAQLTHENLPDLCKNCTFRGV